MPTLLVANRGEIAIRIIRTARELGLRTVAVYPQDDADSLHVRRADDAVRLEGRGPRAYLDIPSLVQAAQSSGADFVHPGYGFLSETAQFARAVAEAGLTFVGPSPETLDMFGDKVRARALASACSIPTPAGEGPVDLDGAVRFLRSLESGRSMMLKAVSGGGGRGMRVIDTEAGLRDAFERASSEAIASFGNGALYVEEIIPAARHIEVQIAGDGTSVIHLLDRECTLQRRRQKLIETAPAPCLPASLREQLHAAAVELGRASAYRGVGTMEFLVFDDNRRFVFIEGNARIQVEHTVTEEILGLDLIAAQIGLAQGRSLKSLGLKPARLSQVKGFAIQARINLETMQADGSARPGGGLISVWEAPSGPGVRTDAAAYAGYQTSPAYDPLIAKVIVRGPGEDPTETLKRLGQALSETRLEGPPTNIAFLRSLLSAPEVLSGRIDTLLIDRIAARLIQESQAAIAPTAPEETPQERAGARIGSDDPLGVLKHGRRPSADTAPGASRTPAASSGAGPDWLTAPMQGTLVSLSVGPGDTVWAGRVVAVMEAMKMEHEVTAAISGVVGQLGASPGDTIFEGHGLLRLIPREVTAPDQAMTQAEDPDRIRPDLAEALARRAAGHDENRPEAVARRRRTGRRTARENIADLCDEGSFVEYGSVVIAAQRRRRTLEDLIANTTGDGMVCGLGHVNGAQFPPERSRVMAMSYDYMVLAGTQGKKNHEKKDRMFEIAERHRLPVILFAEGGGGRPGDTDVMGVAGLDCLAFNYFARLSGLAPLVGVTTGRCFAGNAVLLGCCDVIIATEGSNIGVGGPAMIEGGGLGVFTPEEVGPLEVQVANGVVDIAVKDEAEAVDAARRYLSYFQGPLATWSAPDARNLRRIVPENRLRYYDMRLVIEGIADIGSILELRRGWGAGIITSLIRIEGRPVGVVANNPGHLSGAIDAPGADKAARFMQLCDAFDIPILTLIDCPGIMVGPEIERTALVRHACRLMVTGANLNTPLMSVVIRKAYGLGAQAMAGGSFKTPLFTLTWPTGEFGGMGLEGAVKLGFRKELEAIEDLAERKAAFDKMVAQSYERGKAVNMASHFELDDVIDPAETRRYILGALSALPPPVHRTGKKRPNIDTW
ncbi:MAG: ATP-grasp domain-containing protein [Alphaproteobacteria bacterium]|nr:ATP-grasp domain-containing protein [Alphaproteobacteria bacterium]